MKADFSGYATKAGVKCTDGKTIMPDAFKSQDKHRVPLVWHHGHHSPENVLGHAILENRADGVYAYGFFNDTPNGQLVKAQVLHGDLNALSIWANQLVQRAGMILHGAIREVSVVLAGANPGAYIENVTIAHADGSEDEGEDILIIHSSDLIELETDLESEELEHADGDETVEEVFNSLNDKQKDVVYFMIGEALAAAGADNVAQDDLSHADGDSVADVFNKMSDVQKQVVYFMIGEALAEEEVKQDALSHSQEGNNTMTNVFEQGALGGAPSRHVLSHAAMQEITANAKKPGATLKTAVLDYVAKYNAEHIEHGITDIDTLFPDAKLLDSTPEWNKRRTEWVDSFLGATSKSPFSRVRTMSADLTHPEARAKGYVKGTMKKEEFFGLIGRVTEPKTIYKKQKLDRDDILDITDFDVVAWLKAEMRIMLDEEIARAALIGDGRPVDHEDKISETNIRPIAKDAELYTTQVNVNVNDASSSMDEVTDAVIMHRHLYKGTGAPNGYMSEFWIGKFLTHRDNDGRRVYKTLDEVAAELRLKQVIPCEVLADEPDIIMVMVNPVDYVFGTDKGGQVSMFDDFDIDFNQYKYLIETRLSGALRKIKSAMVFRSMSGDDELVVPAAPLFDPDTGEIDIVDTPNVVYKNGAGTTLTAAGGPYVVAPGTTYVVNATPAAGYYFGTSEGDSWTFTQEA